MYVNIRRLLRQILQIGTKLNHLTIKSQRNVDDRGDEIMGDEIMGDEMGKEITSLLTQITTKTSIKSLYLDPLWLAPEYNEYLRMWYGEPFGNCNIPQMLDLKGGRSRLYPRRNVMFDNTTKAVYVAKICETRR